VSRGRKSISFRRGDVARPPSDQPWTWKSVEMHQAPAFRKMSTACAEVVRFLEIEYLNSGGTDNGRLKAPYRQLAEWGLHRNRVKPAIDEAVERQLVEIMVPGGYRGFARSQPALYRLTYLPTRKMTSPGVWEWEAPTDEWRRYRPAKISSNATTCVPGCYTSCTIGQQNRFIRRR
jgi:hypothetical protein